MTITTSESHRGKHERFIELWLDQVCADRGLPNSVYKVASALAKHRNRASGLAWPSQATLMAATRLGETCVRKGTRLLEAHGHLAVAPGQGRRSTRYRFLIIERAAEKGPEAAEWPEQAETGTRSTSGEGHVHVPVPPAEEMRAGAENGARSSPAEVRARAPDLLSHLSKKKGETGARARATPQFCESAREEKPATARPGGEAGKAAKAEAEHPAVARPAFRPAGRASKAFDGDYFELEGVWSVRPWIDVDHAAAWAAYVEATREADPTVILAGARAWIAGIDAPRYLPALSKWLAGRGWEKAPPQRMRREGATQRRYGERHYGRKPDLARIALLANGAVERSDGRLVWPDGSLAYPGGKSLWGLE